MKVLSELAKANQELIKANDHLKRIQSIENELIQTEDKAKILEEKLFEAEVYIRSI